MSTAWLIVGFHDTKMKKVVIDSTVVYTTVEVTPQSWLNVESKLFESIV